MAVCSGLVLRIETSINQQIFFHFITLEKFLEACILLISAFFTAPSSQLSLKKCFLKRIDAQLAFVINQWQPKLHFNSNACILPKVVKFYWFSIIIK